MRFRRKSKPDRAGKESPSTDVDPATGRDAGEEGTADDVAGGAGASGEATGPLDFEDLPADDRVGRVDLGSLLITPEEGRELRLQVDENSGQVQAVVLAGSDGALEIRAFAAPRHGDLWSEVRPQIAADMSQRGGTASEEEGRFGTELHCRIQVARTEGKATQSSRIVGINGSRWMLRATFLGSPAADPDSAGPWEDLLTRVVVRRGGEPMPVGDPLPLQLPDDATRVSPPEG